MDIRIVREPMAWSEVAALAREQFGEMIKAAVDVERRVVALGGELHSDEESLLLSDGSRQENLWGINLYPDRPEAERVEFDSMINVRPSQGNRSRGIEDPRARAAVEAVLRELITP